MDKKTIIYTWGYPSYDDQDEVVRHFADIKIDSKALKAYFEKYHKWIGYVDDYYGTINWVTHDGKEIFKSGGYSKKMCWLSFISSIKTERDMQEWYMKNFQNK